MIGAIFIPVTYVYLVVTLLDMVQRHRRLLQWGWGTGTFFFLANGTSYAVADVQPQAGFSFWPQPGPLFHLFLFWYSGYFGYALYLLFHWRRGMTGLDQRRITLLALGSVVAFLGSMTLFLLWYDHPVPPHGTILLTACAVAGASILIPRRFPDWATAVERASTAGILMGLIILPTVPVLLIAQKWFFGSINFFFAVSELVIFLVVLIVATTMQKEAQALIRKMLFKNRYAQNETVRSFSKSLISILELRDLTHSMLESICPLLSIRSGGIYLRTSRGQDYQARSSYGKDPKEWPILRSGKMLPLNRIGTEGQKALTLQELRSFAIEPGECEFVEELALLGTEVCLPLINKNRLVGFCLFGPKIGGGTYSSQDLDLLTALSQEASIALENALLYEELKQSQSLIRRTDRLRSLETMAGGLAHEIRNPLTSIKAFVDLAPERKDDEQFLARFSKVVREDVNRIERLTREILDYAKPTEPFLREEDLNEIVEACLYTLRVRPSHELVVIETDLAHPLPKIFADRQQLKQVILNVLFNAVEAMTPAGGVLSVRTKRIASDIAPDWVQLEVRDTGKGIDAKDAEHIFDPFFTTKHLSQEYEGTGLGLAIAHQIIQEHQGRIEVESQKGQGTTFYINLPSYQVPRPAAPKISGQARSERKNPEFRA